MIPSTVCELSLLETLEQKLQANVSVSLLAELERELLRLRSDLSAPEWKAFCDAFQNRSSFANLQLGAVSGRRLAGVDFDLTPAVLDVVLAESFPARASMVPSPTHTVSAWEFSLPASRSVRARKAYFAGEIAETIRTTVKPRILILGGGPLREANEPLQGAHLYHAEFVALSPEACHSRVPSPSQPLRFENGNWSDLSRLRSSLGLFDLVYSFSWLDSTDDSQASEWLAAGAELLRTGGRLLAANFAPGSRDAGWIEAFWNWHPKYRSEEHLAHLAMNLKNPGIRGHAVSRDESGGSAFIEIHSL